MKKTSVHRPLQASLSGVLRELRLKNGLSQTAVAEAIGIAQTAISDLEINERRPDLFVIAELCELYGQPSLDKLMAEVKRRAKGGKVALPPRLIRKDSKRKRQV